MQFNFEVNTINRNLLDADNVVWEKSIDKATTDTNWVTLGLNKHMNTKV